MTVPAEVREHWREARACARGDGLVPALTLLSRALSPDAPPRGPRGHAVVPRDLLGEYAEFGDDQDEPDPGDGAGAGAADLLPGLAILPPVSPAASPAAARTTAPAQTPPDPYTWGTGLAWLRLGHSERLREACVAYLAARRVEGTSLLLQQMVKGALADALIEQLEIEGVLDDLAEAGPGADPDDSPLAPVHPLDAPALALLQAQITEVDRALLRLLGAYGFTTEEPGLAAYASELLADVYCGRPGPGRHHDNGDGHDGRAENDRNTPEGTV